MKASLAEDDMILHVNFAESWRNDQQDAIQNAYLGTKSFSIFAPCCYTKPIGPDDLQNDSLCWLLEALMARDMRQWDVCKRSLIR